MIYNMIVQGDDTGSDLSANKLKRIFTLKIPNSFGLGYSDSMHL